MDNKAHEHLRETPCFKIETFHQWRSVTATVALRLNFTIV